MSRVTNQLVSLDEAEVACGSATHVTELTNGTKLTHATELKKETIKTLN